MEHYLLPLLDYKNGALMALVVHAENKVGTVLELRR
jgi:hypothetical protein